MSSFDEIINSRRSIRKYSQDPIPEKDIDAMIEAATKAPSGCNCQCWYFVCCNTKESIDGLKTAVENGIKRFYSSADEILTQVRLKQISFFANAPLVIVVYNTKMTYHAKKVIDYYASKGFNEDEFTKELGSPDLLSCGAAIENLILKATDLGYGACWMNDPLVAKEEINEFCKVPSNYELVSVIPIGKSEYFPREKELKDKNLIMKII